MQLYFLRFTLILYFLTSPLSALTFTTYVFDLTLGASFFLPLPDTFAAELTGLALMRMELTLLLSLRLYAS